MLKKVGFKITVTLALLASVFTIVMGSSFMDDKTIPLQITMEEHPDPNIVINPSE